MIVKSIASLFRNKLLLLTTIIPTVLAIVYFGLIASDVLHLRSPLRRAQPRAAIHVRPGLSAQGGRFLQAQDDAYTVQDFVTSRDALQALDAELGIKKAYASADVDIFSRFAGLDWDDSLEAFHSVSSEENQVQVDTASSIATLTVKAFNADDAFNVNERLVELAEHSSTNSTSAGART